MQKNAESVLSASEVRGKEQSEIRSGDFTMYYSGGEKAEAGVAIAVHERILRSVVRKSVCNDRNISLNLRAEPVIILLLQVYIPTLDYEDD
jgi:hypothetical protein